MDRDCDHTYTLSPAIKPVKNAEGKAMRIALTHGWTEFALGGRAGGRKVETIHFTGKKAAIAYADAKKWVRK